MVERRREEEERRRREEGVVEARSDLTNGLINAPIVDLDAVLLPVQDRVDQVDPAALLPQVIDVASALVYVEEVCVIVIENCVTVSRMSSAEQAPSVVVPSVVTLESTSVPSKSYLYGIPQEYVVI